MYIPSIDQLPRWGSRALTVSFPLPAQPLNLCMICEEKNPLRFPLLCGFFHFFVHPSVPRLAAPRWVKACGVGMTLDLEERNSVQDEGENPPPNSDTCESEPEHNRIFVRPR